MTCGFRRLVWIVLLAAGSGLHGQQGVAPVSPGAPVSGAKISFRYENPQLQPAQYSFEIHEDGSGEYRSEPGSTPPPDTPSYHPLAQAQQRPVKLSAATTEQIFAIAREQKFFSIACEDKKTKVAFQGTKELAYTGPDGSGSCTYNWSKLASIQKLTKLFESIAFTLEEGRRLDIERKHDHLAVDAELGMLLDALKEGRAMEIQTIQPTLQEIVDDDAMMERARSRARKLLEEDGTSSR